MGAAKGAGQDRRRSGRDWSASRRKSRHHVGKTKTAAGDAAGSLGELALKSKAATGIMEGLTNVIRGEPTTPDQKGALAAGGTAAVGAAVGLGKLLAAPVAAMNNAASARERAAAAAQNSAAAAMRGSAAAGRAGAAAGAAGAAGGAAGAAGAAGGAAAGAGGAAGAAAGGAAAGAAARKGIGRRLVGKVLKSLPVVGTAIAVGEVIVETMPDNVKAGVVDAVKEGFRTGGVAGAYGPEPTKSARDERKQKDLQKKFDDERKTAIDKANGDIKKYEDRRAKVAKKIADIEEVGGKRELKPAMVEDYINRTAEGARLDEAIARKKAELAAIEAKPPTEVKPRIEPSKPKSFIDEINNKDLEPKSIRLPPGTPSPVADPRKSGTAGMPAPSQSLDLLKVAADNAGTEIADSVVKLETASGAFNSVFAQIPGQMATGGERASSIITSGASSAGAAYGNAAVAAIQAAVANINVNVKSRVAVPIPAARKLHRVVADVAK